MTDRRPLMAGNWKMNVNHLEAIALVQKLAFALNDADFEAVDVAVLPPFTDLRSVQTLIDGDGYRIAYGAQDISVHDSGAFTGEISGAMLAKLGCTYVLAGHSERREYHHEDDTTVNAKVRAALKHKITPIMCVGEGLEVRQEGRQVEHVLAQVSAGLDGLESDKVAGLVIAYEPVWAIGTGRTATPEQAQQMHAAIRGYLSGAYPAFVAAQTRIQYGGSVKPSNAAELLAQPDIDGALVGGASLDAESFRGILAAAIQARG
jgi:triosephosphate isomerase